MNDPASAGPAGEDDEAAVDSEWRKIEAERIAEEQEEAREDLRDAESPRRRWPWLAFAAALVTGLIAAALLNSPAAVSRRMAAPRSDTAPPAQPAVMAPPGPESAAITIHVGSGTQTQTEAGYPILSGSMPVVKTGDGALVLDQANTLTGSTVVQAGVLRLTNPAALESSRLVVMAGGTVQVAPLVIPSVAGLDLAGGNGLLDVAGGGLTVLGGMADGELVAEILEGRGDGSWTGTSGITSSTAAADLAAGVPRAVGWIDNGDGSLTVAYAAPGDTNIDWSIDILDASNILAVSRFDSGEPATWLEGDFNYDGLADILDAADMVGTNLYDAGAYHPRVQDGETEGVTGPSLGQSSETQEP